QDGGKSTYKMLELDIPEWKTPEMEMPQYDPEWDIPIAPAVEDIVASALETTQRRMTPNGTWVEDRPDFDDAPRIEQPKETAQPVYAAPTQGGGTQEIKITVNGEGAIKVGNGVDKSQLTASIMRQIQNKLPSIIMDMLQEETFVEGDRTYAL
ncbi:MAG: hypothetical protein NC131_22020, partial [Roseburia sp.]|nr:hypothetical protein [Roseburia sp.]